MKIKIFCILIAFVMAPCFSSDDLVLRFARDSFELNTKMAEKIAEYDNLTQTLTRERDAALVEVKSLEAQRAKAIKTTIIVGGCSFVVGLTLGIVLSALVPRK